MTFDAMKELLVQETKQEILVAVIESGRLMEAYIEPKEDMSIVGNVYAGVVQNVLPGMQAAFIDVGLEKNAYLYVEDVVSKEELSQAKGKGRSLRIEHHLKQGQTVLVQVKKAPADEKGARVTLDITLPGRYLVVMPLNNYIGVSKKIRDGEERERLKELAGEMIREGRGIVIRTVAEGRSREELQEDYDRLNLVWGEITQKMQAHQGKPVLVRSDLEFTTRILRDVVRSDIDRIIVNTPENEKLVREYVENFIPELRGRVTLQREGGVWTTYQLQNMLQKALNRRVWLDCGGYLVIDRTEAMTVIDVNTGKYTGRESLEETAFLVNMEAVGEIARQIRLRNCGGIILVDFIDMKVDKHRFQLVQALEEASAGDSNKVQVMGLTRLGLLEMTRKKSKRSLSHLMEVTCPMCLGKGQVLSEENRLKLVEQKVANSIKKLGSDQIILRVHRTMAEYLHTSGHRFLQQLEEKYDRKVYVQADPDARYDEIHVEGGPEAGIWY